MLAHSSYLFCCFSPLPFKSLNAKFMLKSLIEGDMDMGNLLRHTTYTYMYNVCILCIIQTDLSTKTSATLQVWVSNGESLTKNTILLIQGNYKNILWNVVCSTCTIFSVQPIYQSNQLGNRPINRIGKSQKSQYRIGQW